VRAAPATTRAAPAGSTPTTTTSGPGPTAAPTTPTTPPVSLASLILDTVPSGYQRQADDVGQTGPTNLAQAALDDVSPTARRALLVTGFVNGYQRQWTSTDGYTIDQVFLYEFSTPKGAQGYAQHWHDTLLSSNAGGPALQSFTPPFLPAGALGLQGQDKSGSTGVVMFAAGNYAVEATVNGGVAAVGDAPADQSGPATSLAVAQYQRLP
jgi:hypothetical protein